MLKKHRRSTKLAEAVHEIDADHAADVATRDQAPLVTEHVVDQRVHVAGVQREVVLVIGRQIAVAVAAQVGGDHLESGLGERRDVAPPDALRLRVPVQQEQRRAALALTHVTECEVVAHHRAVDGERVGRRGFRLRRSEPRVVAQLTPSRRRGAAA